VSWRISRRRLSAGPRRREWPLRGLTLTVRFLCELALLAALAFWGFTVGDGAGAWLLGVDLLPLVDPALLAIYHRQ
jgi:Protein of unknown function (DUF2568)